MTPDQEVSWQAPGFARDQRNPTWYIWSIAAAFVLVVFAFFQENILFALFIIIAEIVLIMFHHDESPQRLYFLNYQGLATEKQMLRLFSDSSAFAIVPFNDRYSELVLRPNKKLQTYMKVLVPNERVADVTQFIGNYLHPFEYQQAFSDTVAKHLGL